MKYENLIIFNTEIGDESINKKVEELKGVMDKGGKFLKADTWGSRQLAYPIRKKENGYYVLFEFEADEKLLSALRSKLKVDKDVLRHCIVRKEG